MKRLIKAYGREKRLGYTALDNTACSSSLATASLVEFMYLNRALHIQYPIFWDETLSSMANASRHYGAI
jgi:hypothetical protein